MVNRKKEKGSDSEENEDREYDVHEVRWRSHRHKIGIKWSATGRKRTFMQTTIETQEQTAQYIRETFMMKECTKFVRKKRYYGNPPAPPCHCGDPEKLHWQEPGPSNELNLSSAVSTPRHLEADSHSIHSSSPKASLMRRPSANDGLLLTPELINQQLQRIDSQKQRKQSLFKAVAVHPALAAGDTTNAAIPAAISKFLPSTRRLQPLPLNAPLIQVEEEQRVVHDVGCEKKEPQSAPPEGIEWQELESIAQMPTNAFGKVEFANDESRSKPAKYVRLSDTTPTSDVLDLMMNHWRMDQPNRPSLVISVNGGAKNFRLDGKRREIFNQGLVKAAYATNAWMITTGCNMGVMKIVGEAVREGQTLQLARNRVTHNLRCLGIASWGYVQNRHDLASSDGKGCWPATYHVDPVIRHGQPVSLDPNHTHFILVDDGYRNVFRTKFADFRAKLERHIANGNQKEAGIPVVVVLVEGGLESLDFAYESLKNRIPLVLCEGTGRAADILAYAFRNHISENGSADDKARRILLPHHKALVLEKLRNAYGKTLKSSKGHQMVIFEEKLQQISACCQEEELVTVFDINRNEDFDMAILSALLKGRGASPLDQLRLALKWNRSDVAAEELFNDKTAWNWSDLDELMTEALVNNKTDFVKLLLQHGVVMKDYLTVTRLRTLYNAASRSSHLRRMLIEIADASTKIFLCDVKILLEKLLRYVDQAYGLDEVEGLHYKQSQKQQQMHMCRTCGDDGLSPMIGEAHFIKPFKELFIWAVLMNRPVLAKFFWERGENPVMCALVASKLYEGLINEVGELSADLSKQYRAHREEFENLAMNVVQQSYAADAEKALLIIERPHGLWGNLTCQQMAALSNNKRFMATACCQTSIDQKWKRGLRCSFAEVIVGLLCPFYIIFGISFDSAVLGPDDLTVMQKLKIFFVAPVTKFCSHALMYLLFLALYTYDLLFHFDGRNFDWHEILLHSWVICLAVCDGYQILKTTLQYQGKQHERKTITFKWRSNSLLQQMFCLSFWTKLTLIAVILHFVGFGLTFMDQLSLDWTRVICALAIAIFYFRLFRYYMASSYLGPKLFVIKKMFGDVFMFLTILIVIMLAYAVAAQTLLFPVRSFYWGIFTDILYYPYWQLYGELSLEDTIGGNKEGCGNGTLINDRGQYCPRKFWPVALMLAAYLLVGNILLVNLLIAIFTHVFEEVQRNSTEIWKFEMWTLAAEFDNMPVFPPPFNLIETIYRLFLWVAQHGKRFSSVIYLNEKQLENLQIFEKECMNEYLRSLEQTKTSEMGYRVEQLQKQVDNLTKKFEDETRNTSSQLETLGQSTLVRQGTQSTIVADYPPARPPLQRQDSEVQTELNSTETLRKYKSFEQAVSHFENRMESLKNMENIEKKTDQE